MIAFIKANWKSILCITFVSVMGGVAGHHIALVFTRTPPASAGIPAPVVSVEIQSAKDEGIAETKAQEAEALEPTIAQLKTKLESTKKPVQKIDPHALSDQDVANLWSDAGF
jgi:hypothetical protein